VDCFLIKRCEKQNVKVQGLIICSSKEEEEEEEEEITRV